jgi:hypothetical protein
MVKPAILLVAVLSPGFAPVPASKPSAKPTLVLEKPQPARQDGGVFVFKGTFPGRIHRSGPEHFKLTRLSDGKQVSMQVAYDQDALDEVSSEDGKGLREVRKKVKRLKALKVQDAYNRFSKGFVSSSKVRGRRSNSRRMTDFWTCMPGRSSNLDSATA